MARKKTEIVPETISQVVAGRIWREEVMPNV